MGKTIKVSGHVTLGGGYDGETFILEGKGASLTISNNADSHFIMAGSDQTVNFALNSGAGIYEDNNESVAIQGSHDTITAGGLTDRVGGFVNIAGFGHAGSEVIAGLAWDVQYQGYTGPDGAGGYDFYNGLGTTFDFMGDSNVKETMIGNAGHLISLTDG